MKAIILAAAIIAGTAATAFAQYAPRIEYREARQAARIHHGFYSGALNWRETRSLIHGQHRIHRMERRARFDGRLTFRERMRIAHAQHVQSRRIWRMKHNWR